MKLGGSGTGAGTRLQRLRPAFDAIAFGLATVATTAIAIPRMMTGFAPYDDEGYMLVSLNQYLDHGALYDSVFGQYGPFYFEFWGAIFGIFGLGFDHDTGRIATIAVWVMAALMLGVAVRLMSKSLVLGIGVQLLSFSALVVSVSEPMHPGGLIALVLAAMVLVSCAVRPRLSIGAFAAIGALLAALALIKINVGAFAIAAVALACVVSYRPFLERAWIRVPVEAGVVLLPVLLMASNLGESWARGYAFHVAASVLAIVLTLRVLRPPLRDPEELGWLAGGFLLTTLAVLAVAIASGTSPGGLFDGLIGQPLNQADAFSIPFPYSDRLLYFDVVAVGGALAYWYAVRGGASVSPWSAALGVVCAIVGLQMALSVIGKSMFFDGGAVAGFSFGLLAFVWLALPFALGGSGRFTFARLVLPPLAVLQALHAYPVAGSQLGWSAVLLVAVGAVCLGDGVRVLTTAGEVRERRAALGFLGVAAVAVSAFVLATTIREPLRANRAAHDAAASLGLPGARDVRLSPEEVEKYRQVTAAINAQCGSLVTLPGMSSFNIWAQIEPPTTNNATAWMTLFDDERQQRVIDEISDAPDLCLLENEGQALAWTVGVPPSGPLVDYLSEGFEPVVTIGEYTLSRHVREAGE